MFRNSMKIYSNSHFLHATLKSIVRSALTLITIHELDFVVVILSYSTR